MWELEWHEPNDPSSFILFYLESVLLHSLSQSLCPVLSSGTKHNASTWRWLLPSSSLASIQTWESSTTSGRRLTFGTASSLLSIGEEQCMGPLESYSGVCDILVHPSTPGWAYLQSTSFIGRIFHSLHTWGRRDLSSFQGSQSVLTALRC